MSKAPRAIRLDLDTPENAGEIAVLPELEPIEPEPAAATPLPRRSRFGWGSLFVAALSALLALATGIWAEQTIRWLLALHPALGFAALALTGLALLALLVMLARVLRDILRERRIEALRERAVAALADSDLAKARGVTADLERLYASRPDTAKGRAELAASTPQLLAARDLLAVAERSLLGPLDLLAQAQVAQAARRVSLVTAVSPRALIDVVFVLVACARLLRAIASVYAGRPGTLGLLRLARQVVGHLVVTGGVAAGDAVIQQVLGQGLAARLSAKLGEGVLNGLLTARIGLAAIAVCRPLPFVEAQPPGLSDVAGDLSGWGTPKAG
jgi:putative membrane protein